MGVQTELTRISGAKTDLKAAIQSKGVAVAESARIDAYPALVQAITQGGDLSDVTLWIADFSTWDGVTVTEGYKDTDGREITMVLISSKPLGTLIRVADSDGGNGAANYEIADINNLVPGGVVLVRKNLYSTSEFGSTANYPNGTLDNLIKATIYNEMPQQLRDKMMDVTFNLYRSGDITRKMFALTCTMAGFGNNSGVAEGKALQLYTSNASRLKTFDGSTAYWWLSSQNPSGHAWSVSTSGSAYIGGGTLNIRGVVPAFVIPQSLQIADSANADGSYNIKYTETEKISCTVNMGSAEEQPKAALPIISCNGNLTLKICNNANDANPAWETAANETVHNFANTAKTAAKWAIGLKIDITCTAGENLFLNEPVVLTM